MKWGMDSRQGPHQVAQKSRRTTFPLSWERVISWSSRVLRVKSGARAGEVFFSLAQWGRRNANVTQRHKITRCFQKDRRIFLKSQASNPLPTGRQAGRLQINSKEPKF